MDTAELATSLAEKLGVDQAEMEAALEEVVTASRPSAAPSGRPSGEPSSGTSGGQRLQTMAKALAEKLDLTESDVLAALQEVMPSGRGQPSR